MQGTQVTTAATPVREQLRTLLTATQEAQRAYRRITLVRKKDAETEQAVQQLASAAKRLYEAERLVACVLRGASEPMDDNTGELWWIIPATRKAEVLRAIVDLGEASAPQIGERLGLHRGRVINICHQLERRGLVRSRRDPQYRGRRLLFSPTTYAAGFEAA